jgi:hypothetical protein
MRRAALEALTVLFLAAAAPAGAAPLPLDGPDAADRLAAAITRYAGATTVTWVVGIADPAERAVLMKQVADRLEATGPGLIERVRAETAPPGTPTVAWIEASPPAATNCSWRVTLTDPAAPSPGATPVAIPLARGDRVPATAAATFEVGFSGPLQSTLYAFGETRPGSVRDLAAAPETAIPVEPAGTEVLVLVRARKPVPYLDRIAARLATAPGLRAPLGEDAALASRFAGRSRGIGALIQLMDPKMVVAENAPSVEPEAPEQPGDRLAAADLVETCLYTLVPAAGM